LENVDIFYGHLEYFVNIWDILWPFGTFCVHLVHFFWYWYLAPRKIWQLWCLGLFAAIMSMLGKHYWRFYENPRLRLILALHRSSIWSQYHLLFSHFTSKVFKLITLTPRNNTFFLVGVRLQSLVDLGRVREADEAGKAGEAGKNGHEGQTIS
jgi:hypothetical protein